MIIHNLANYGPDCLESSIQKMIGKMSLVIYNLLHIPEIIRIFACYFDKYLTCKNQHFFRNNRLQMTRNKSSSYYYLINQPGHKLSWYQWCFLFRFFMVFLCLGLSVFSTIEDHEYEDLAETSLFYLEVLVVVWFGIEFIVRLWSSGCRSRYQGWIGRLRFMKSPFCIIGVVFL